MKKQIIQILGEGNFQAQTASAKPLKQQQEEEQSRLGRQQQEQQQHTIINIMTDSEQYWVLADSIGEGNGTPLQYSCLENPMDEEPGGLPSMELHRVGHDWSDLAAAAGDSIRSSICDFPGSSDGKESTFSYCSWGSS